MDADSRPPSQPRGYRDVNDERGRELRRRKTVHITSLLPHALLGVAHVARGYWWERVEADQACGEDGDNGNGTITVREETILYLSGLGCGSKRAPILVSGLGG
jgi:hypothetical protein